MKIHIICLCRSKISIYCIKYSPPEASIATRSALLSVTLPFRLFTLIRLIADMLAFYVMHMLNKTIWSVDSLIKYYHGKK